MASTADPMEEVAKRMQGLKDSRSKIGELARGKNMYPGGNNAHSGPGGPDMGRPPEQPRAVVPQAAMEAVRQQTGGMPQPPAPQQQGPQMQQLQNKVSPGSVMNSRPVEGKLAAAQSNAMGGLARAALQAAAKRKMQRSR